MGVLEEPGSFRLVIAILSRHSEFHSICPSKQHFVVLKYTLAFIFFLFFCFSSFPGHPLAYGVLRPGIRSEPQM